MANCVHGSRFQKTKAIFYGLMVFVFVASINAGNVLGTTISHRPQPSVLLGSGDFIAVDRWDGATLYSGRDGSPQRRFVTNGGRIFCIEASPDEQYVGIAAGGFVEIIELRTGKTLWSETSDVGNISFSGDGRSLVACAENQIVIFDVLTGRRIVAIRFPAGLTDIFSAALSPDGSMGAAVGLTERVYIFESSTQAMKDTGITGAWPVRFASSGKYIALRSNNTGTSESLRVLSGATFSEVRDVGRFQHISRIKTLEDGRLGVVALPEDRDSALVAGYVYEGNDHRLSRQWSCSTAIALHSWLPEQGMDFDSRKQIGVCTSYNLITQLVNLDTMKPLLTIDNSAHYREAMVSSTVRGSSPLTWILLGTGALLLVLYVLRRFLGVR